MRIRIPPNEIAVFSSRLKAVSVELENSRQTLSTAAGRLDWEVSRRPEIDSLVNKALTAAIRLSDEGYRLSSNLKKVECAFQEVDQNLAQLISRLFLPITSQGESAINDAIYPTGVALAFSQAGLQRKKGILNNEHSNQIKSLNWIKGLIKG